MKNHLFFNILLTILLSNELVHCLGGLPSFGGKKVAVYRFLKHCPGTEKKGIAQMKSIKFEKTPNGLMGITGTLVLKEDIGNKLDSFQIDAYKCRSFSEQETCEFVTKIPFQRSDVCKKFEEKDQFWSEFMEKVTPKIKCPIMKNSYKISKGTFDIDKVLKIAPMVQDGYWQFMATASMKDKLISCFFVGIDLQTKKS